MTKNINQNQGEAMRFYLNGDISLMETLGDKVELAGDRGESFAVHATPYSLANPDDDLWRVSHIETGFRVSSGGSINEAIENANRRLAEVTDEQFNTALSRARATTDVLTQAVHP
jgi:hypothetical protein